MVQKFTRPFICFILAALLWIPIGGFGNAYAADDFTNLALQKTATSRTTYGSLAPSYAVDGGTSRYYCSAQASGDQWLQVDLGDSYYIDRIELLPEHGYRNALTNFDLLISDQPFSSTSSIEEDRAQANQGGWQTFFDGVIATGPGVFAVDHFGRYVRIRTPNVNGWFTVDEIEVYGAESSRETIVNISATENYNKDTAVTRTLFPGSYTISLIGSDTEGAEYDAWVYKADTPLAGCRLDGTCKYDGWINRYYYYGTTYTKVPETAFYACKEYASRPENKPADQTLLLEEETEVLFYLNDSNPSNNTGGISLLVSPN